MPLQKLVFRPGINREGTAYDNEGGWFDCNLVRSEKVDQKSLVAGKNYHLPHI